MFNFISIYCSFFGPALILINYIIIKKTKTELQRERYRAKVFVIFAVLNVVILAILNWYLN
jgi:hypothetical protein